MSLFSVPSALPAIYVMVGITNDCSFSVPYICDYPVENCPDLKRQPCLRYIIVAARWSVLSDAGFRNIAHSVSFIDLSCGYLPQP